MTGPAAFSLSPPLAALRRALERRLGRPVRMSGSGSTLFTLYDAAEEADAKAAAGEIDDAVGVRTRLVEAGISGCFDRPRPRRRPNGVKESWPLPAPTSRQRAGGGRL